MKGLSQRQRVLRALILAGDRGITAVAFAAPNVIDDGDPIMRVAARIDELREDGFVIDSSERRKKLAVYKLVGPVDVVVGAEASPPAAAPAEEPSVDQGTGQLFDLTFDDVAPRRTYYEQEDAA